MSDPNQNNSDSYVNTGFIPTVGSSTAPDPAMSSQNSKDDMNAGNSMQDLIELNNQISKLEEADNSNIKSPTPAPSLDPSKMKPENLDAQLNALSGLTTPQEHQNKQNNLGVDKNSDFVNSPTQTLTPPVKGGEPIVNLAEEKSEPPTQSASSNPFKKFANKFSGIKNELVVDNQPPEKVAELPTSGPEGTQPLANVAKIESSASVTDVQDLAQVSATLAPVQEVDEMPIEVNPTVENSLQDLADQIATQLPLDNSDKNLNTNSSSTQTPTLVKEEMGVIFSDKLPVEEQIDKLASEITNTSDSQSDRSSQLTGTLPTSDQLPKLSEIKEQIANENNSNTLTTAPAGMQSPLPPVAPDPMGLKSGVSDIVQMDPNGMDNLSNSPVASQPDATPNSPVSPAVAQGGHNVSEILVNNVTQNPAAAISSTFVDKVSEDLTPAPKDTKSKYNYADMEIKSNSKRYPYTIDQLLDIVVERDASDLHITVGYPAMIRVDGALVNAAEELVTPSQAVDLILPVLPEQKKELLDVNREVDLAYPHRQDARFRINAYYQKQTLAGAFRLIPNMIRSIDDLNLPQIYHKITKLKQGLVLVTGPTGSGKSTTLAAIIQEINETRPDHIITIEDPVEYVFPKARSMVDQRELHEDTHSWEIALRSALRQDPDVMLVGEMRDYETIASAITLAETGHLVFATLHTNSAAQTLDRIVDVFPEHQQSQIRSQLSNNVEAVIAQRLIPLQKGGRAAVSEIMIATPAIRNLIREAKTHQIDNVIRTSADVGMISLEHTLVKMVRENLITMERAMEYAVHPEEIVRLMKS